MQRWWHDQKAFQGSHLSAHPGYMVLPFRSHLLLVATQLRVDDVFLWRLYSCCMLRWVVMMYSTHVPFEKFGSIFSVDFPQELLHPTQIGSTVPQCQDL